jgi:hypothetical protein
MSRVWAGKRIRYILGSVYTIQTSNPHVVGLNFRITPSIGMASIK